MVGKFTKCEFSAPLKDCGVSEQGAEHCRDAQHGTRASAGRKDTLRSFYCARAVYHISLAILVSCGLVVHCENLNGSAVERCDNVSMDTRGFMANQV